MDIKYFRNIFYVDLFISPPERSFLFSITVKVNLKRNVDDVGGPLSQVSSAVNTASLNTHTSPAPSSVKMEFKYQVL